MYVHIDMMYRYLDTFIHMLMGGVDPRFSCVYICIYIHEYIYMYIWEDR